jgi:hypothetical protein
MDPICREHKNRDECDKQTRGVSRLPLSVTLKKCAAPALVLARQPALELGKR